MLIKRAVVEALKNCRMCFFFKSVNNSQSCHKSSAQLYNQELVEQLQHFKIAMFHLVP